MSSSSRCASSKPVCGRMLSTRTPLRFSAAVMSMSGIAPGGRSTTRSSIAYPDARSTTSSDRISAPTEPSATANEPRLPGRSSSWTRSRYEGTRNTVAQRQRLSIHADGRLREERTAGDGRLREERTAGDGRLREERTAGDGRLREERTAGDERLREEWTAERALNQAVTRLACRVADL